MADVRGDVIDMLRRHLAAEGPVSEVTTHASHLLIGASRVFKLKRPLAYGYLDYSTPQKRRAAVEAEFTLNRRTAPSLYLATHSLVRTAQGLALDGEGELVDAVLEMRRFPDDCLLDRVAIEGRLTRPLLSRLAAEIAQLHRGAAVEIEDSTDRMQRVLAINAEAFAATGLLGREPQLRTLLDACEAAFRQQRSRLLRRAAAGKVRRCHGDLTLRNICILDGVPTPFDCLEFSEDLATTDVLYDVAFVLMDLWHSGLKEDANWLWNRYLDHLDEERDASLMPFFMAVRAMVRSHVAAARAKADGAGEAWTEALAYALTASELLAPQPQRFIAVGGFSGSGKSTVAASLAPRVGPAPGARVLASDRIRKAMFGRAPEDRLPPEAYAPEVSGQVYRALLGRGAMLLAEGVSVILDAVFDRAEDRAAAETAMPERGPALSGFWLDAPASLQAERVAARRGDVSDATVEVLAAQRQRGHGKLAWHCIDASQPVEKNVNRILGSMET